MCTWIRREQYLEHFLSKVSCLVHAGEYPQCICICVCMYVYTYTHIYPYICYESQQSAVDVESVICFIL